MLILLKQIYVSVCFSFYSNNFFLIILGIPYKIWKYSTHSLPSTWSNIATWIFSSFLLSLLATLYRSHDIFQCRHALALFVAANRLWTDCGLHWNLPYVEVLFHYYYFTIAGVKKIVCYTEDFVIYRFVILRFHCIVFRIRKQWDHHYHILIWQVKTIVRSLHFTVTDLKMVNSNCGWLYGSHVDTESSSVCPATGKLALFHVNSAIQKSSSGFVNKRAW